MSEAIPAKQYTTVPGGRMAYVEQGSGRPILFLHGNPTSSYLWRNIMPLVSAHGRCLAPDLVGMGDSDKIPGDNPERYSFATHRRYLDALLEQLDLGDEVVLVVHDWGSALGFDWACRHAERVAGIVYMEALVRPLTWSEWPEPSRPIFETLRSSNGEHLILDKNVFIERILTASIQRKLSDAELDAYRAPFTEAGESRRPMLSWPRDLPLGGDPIEVVDVVQQYADWMAENQIPKLFINADPGAILVGAQREFCRTWPNQAEVTVPGIHFIQEDAPREIGDAISEFVTTLPNRPATG